MTDQCINCELKGDIKMCLASECFQHENWYAKNQQSRINHLENELSDIKNGAEIVIPSSKGHAQNMELVAKRWLKDNT